MSAIDPINLIGLFLHSVVLVEGSLLAIVLLKKYRETHDRLAFHFVLPFVALVFSVLFLILEEIFLRFITIIPLFRFFLYLAMICISFSVFVIDLIAFELTFPDKIRLLIPLTILIILCNLVYAFLIFAGEPWSFIRGGDLFFIDPFPIIILLLTIPTTIFPVIVYFYFAFVNRDNKSLRNRSIWLGTAILILYVGVMIEVAALPSVFLILTRITFIVSTTIFYLVFTKEENL